jgi:hypothetical protein
MSDGEAAAFAIIFIAAVLFAAPICNWLLLGKPVYSIVPQNCNMTAVIPGTPFPYATSDFYGKMYGMNDLSLQKDWYYSKWLMYPGVQGICPWNEDITIQCTDFDSKGVCRSYTGGIKYCFRPESDAQPDAGQWVKDIWQRMDLANAAAGIASDMVGGYTIFRQIYFSTLHLAIGCMVVYGGFPLLSCCALICVQDWEKRHNLKSSSVILSFLFPLATILFILYWSYAIRLWNQARNPAANPAFTTAENWLTMFPHCESVEFIGKETSTGAVGTFSALEQVMMIFPPFLWFPGLIYCIKEFDNILRTLGAIFETIFSRGGVTQFDNSLSGADNIESGKGAAGHATSHVVSGGSHAIELHGVQKAVLFAAGTKAHAPAPAPSPHSKAAACQANCIANQRDHIRGYESASELAAFHPEYAGGVGCDQCGKVLENEKLLHCSVHQVDFCLSCAVSQNSQKVEECRTVCIANQRACVKGYDGTAALAAVHREYAAGGSCDKCLKSLCNEQLIHCETHRLDFCLPCGLSQDGQKIAECKADCIAKERLHAKNYANLAALAAVHSQYADGGGCDQCGSLLGSGRVVHCELHHIDLCATCAYDNVQTKSAGVDSANPLSAFDLELE